jgi:hypothetical protein
VSYRPPTIFNILWRAVSPFIDPLTREKLVFLTPKSPIGAAPAGAARARCCRRQGLWAAATARGRIVAAERWR